MNRLLLLTLVTMLGCGGSEQPPPPPDAVSRVTVKGENRIASESSTVLTADVEGTGTYVSDVDWYLLSGEGFLSNAVGASVTYTAPFAQEELTVTIQAVSLMDPSKTATFTLTVSQALPAALMEGTYWGPRSTHDEITTATGPLEPRDYLQETSVTLSRVSDSQVQLWSYGYLGLGFPQGVTLEVLEDGTLTFPLMTSPLRGRDKYCWEQYFLNELDGAPPGFGRWDRQGNLSLNWVLILEQSCRSTSPGGGGYGMATHQLTEAFLGTRR
ncbi:hypothetical protein D7X96_18270 [Corallococcus interemptor]|uniref:Uncharacterized protein n=1 Tax=Corallococcus interemptor TaxID=2316720 RepID=A0A3A8QNM7_9BACT|nr:hypothetical protein [Corallococcus interemptor]RKH67945.1 hypothetical protein D7X96_18270 [Corallococcus interemptor]